MAKIIVTGGNGFIGRYVCDELNSLGHELLVLGRHFPKSFPFSYKCVDLRNKELLEEIFIMFKPDIVIHMAAIASVTHGNMGELYEINVCGTENILDALAENSEGARMVFLSTAGIYGNQSVERLSEKLSPMPENHYSRSKFLCENMLQLYKEYLDIRIVRPFNIIGKGQSKNFFIPKLIENFKNKKSELYVGNIDTIRDYVDVEYCAKIICQYALAESIGKIRILNICSGKGFSGRDIIDKLIRLTGYEPIIHVDESFVRNHEVYRLVGCPNQLNDFLISNNLIIKQRDIDDILHEMIVAS